MDSATHERSADVCLYSQCMQVIAQPDERYDSYCHSSDFIREHIFPGKVVGCRRGGKRRGVEHVQRIGGRYLAGMWMSGRVLQAGYEAMDLYR